MAIDHAGVLLYEGFEPMDAIGPYEVLSIGADRGPGFETSLCTADMADRVTSARSFQPPPGTTRRSSSSSAAAAWGSTVTS
jgi:hypothetical protein